MTHSGTLKRAFGLGKSAADEPDWEAVFGELLPKVHRFLCYRVNEGAIAEDLTSETFEKVWRARHAYRHDVAAYSTWVFAIARNVVIDHYRRAATHPSVSLDEARSQTDGSSVDEALGKKLDFAALSQVLATLSDRDRDVLALKFGADMAHREIARILNLGESNVGVIVHRALQTLRTRWPGPSPFEND